jgi:hypothetical protein
MKQQLAADRLLYTVEHAREPAACILRPLLGRPLNYSFSLLGTLVYLLNWCKRALVKARMLHAATAPSAAAREVLCFSLLGAPLVYLLYWYKRPNTATRLLGY